MDLTIIGTGLTVIGLTYTFLRNFKNDVNKHIDKIELRLDKQDERMFWLMTGKKLDDIILEQKNKEDKKDEKEK